MINSLQNEWSDPLGYYRPDILVHYSGHEWNTYRRALKHFWGVDPQEGQCSLSLPLSTDLVPKIGEDGEYELTLAVLTFQHELQHYYQAASTATGRFVYLLKSLYWDFIRDFAEHLLKYVKTRTDRPEVLLPLVRRAIEIAESAGEECADLNYGSSVRESLLALMNLFDNPAITAESFTSLWNKMTGFLDQGERREGDTARFVRFSYSIRPADLANPDGITLKELKEGAAHCQEMLFLGALPVRKSTKRRVFDKAHWGDYRRLLDRLGKVSVSEYAFSILPRIAAIALQTPLTSMHLEVADQLLVCLEDTSPTFRAYRIIKAIRDGDLSPPELVLQADGPDVICDYFGWPRISKIMQDFTSQSHYRGVDSTLEFTDERHRSFCDLAISSPRKPVWMGDLAYSKEPEDIEFAVSYLPPFALFGDHLVLQTDPPVAARMAFPLLTTLAAHELLFSQDLSITKHWLGLLCEAFGRISEDISTSMRERDWPQTFHKCFGVQWQAIP